MKSALIQFARFGLEESSFGDMLITQATVNSLQRSIGLSGKMPNQCESRQSAMMRAKARCKWIAEGTFSSRYV